MNDYLKNRLNQLGLEADLEPLRMEAEQTSYKYWYHYSEFIKRGFSNDQAFQLLNLISFDVFEIEE